ncbi:LPXTG-motif cell wall anchor domain-containing protein [Planoprotostelium fungivorum]|uniref:LPXTG-motif cell wall anchor domain-containing protein n=1 Tax=Planoprotostelium fungivorum TaxID=1890364 RepID=A0A2P6NWJ4_9EUKA|nr:LPXTG-motif cell wall anchor domain-containing protein [Planoprotostelium fungivorum]
MKTFSLLLLFAFAGVFAQQYNLVWSDEFNGNSLDRSKWQHEVNCDGGGNNEHQCYTNSDQNVAVRDGSLVLTARIQNGGNGKRFTSGRINTRHSAAWKYGRFEARIKMTDGAYLWPAFWMMPRDSVYGSWAASGEIDIMEHRGGNVRDHSSALHFGGGWPRNTHEGSGSRYSADDLSRGYHIYSATWTPDSIQFFIDNNNFYTMPLRRSFNNAAAGAFPYTQNGQPFDQQFFLILNLAVGGGFFGGEANAINPDMARNWREPSLYVDYVRVYQLGGTPVVPNPPPAPTPNPTPTPSTGNPSTTGNGNNNGNNNGGCAAGACGGNSCCNDQNNGQQCFNPSQHTCASDSFSGKFALCPAGFKACKGACFSPNSHHCVNGNLQAGRGNDVGPTGNNNTPAPTGNSNTPAPTKAPSTKVEEKPQGNCPAGQASCNDASLGQVCYATGGAFDCVDGDRSTKRLCPKGHLGCGTACYPPSIYKCANGWLAPK